MKIYITETQLKNLTEIIKSNNKIECDKCGHIWNFADGGKRPYLCHQCGYENEKTKDETAKWIKCRVCNRRFTQHIYKKKKSTPYCSFCGALN